MNLYYKGNKIHKNARKTKESLTLLIFNELTIFGINKIFNII